jgi:glutaconate CoA-transferase subunit B
MPEYNKMEMMICAAARFLEDGKTVAVGTGAPCAATMVAQKTHAPSLVVAFEAGGIAPLMPQMPISVGDSRTFFRGIMAAGMSEMMCSCSRGFIDYAFLGGAQVDKHGNLNSTVIGEYRRPKVRFPGSGGANDFASFCWRTIVITVQNTSRFVEKLDFLTTPGYLDGPGGRERAGLPPDSGPYKIITDLAVLGFDAATCAMRLESVHPGVSIDDVRRCTGFELVVPGVVSETRPPSYEQLRVLREEVDPLGYVTGRGS